MSHYGIKFLSWLSTNWLLGRKTRKSDFAALMPQAPAGTEYERTHTSISERLGGALYARMLTLAPCKRIFDGLWVRRGERLNVCTAGWRQPIYIKYRGALRRATLRRAEIFNEYGPYAPHTVAYLADMVELGEVWVTDDFEYASTREDAEAGRLSRVGDRHDEWHDIDVLATFCFLREKMAGAVNVGGAWRIVRYAWDAKHRCPVEHPIVTGPIVTEDGHEFRISRTWFPANTFPNKEECRAANEKKTEEAEEGSLPVIG